MAVTGVGLDAGAVRGCRVLLVQLETPVSVIETLLSKTVALDATRILNAAPALEDGRRLFQSTDILIVNETELARYAGADAVPERQPPRTGEPLRRAGGVARSHGLNAGWVRAHCVTPETSCRWTDGQHPVTAQGSSGVRGPTVGCAARISMKAPSATSGRASRTARAASRLSFQATRTRSPVRIRLTFFGRNQDRPSAADRDVDSRRMHVVRRD